MAVEDYDTRDVKYSEPETKKLEGIIIIPAEGGYVVMIESYSEEEGEDIRMVIAESAAAVGDIVEAELNDARK